MYSFLMDHAVKNVWAQPRRDYQHILKLMRLTTPLGEWNTVRIVGSCHDLPLKKTRFHVYQIGQLKPALLGIMSFHTKWKRLDELMEQESMILDVYTANGIMIPRHQVWFKVSKSKSLLFAISENKAVKWNMKDEAIYLRAYSGGRFNAVHLNQNKDLIKVKSLMVSRKRKNIGELLDFYNEYKDRPGHLYIYHNGFYCKDFLIENYQEYDAVELIYDSTIYKKVYFSLNSLGTFDSIKDKKRKYLLTYDGHYTNDIDYFDDIDLFVIKDELLGSQNKGVFLHRNNKDSIRQLTHRDYSLTIPYVEGLMSTHSDHFEDRTDNVKILMLVRRSGLERPLQMVNSRIHELYKLPFHLRKSAMLGIRSNVDVWRADYLEQSPYVKLMSLPDFPNEDKLIIDAYGYNSIAKITGDSPVQRKDFFEDGNGLAAKLPFTLQTQSAVYEYDKQGYLINRYNHQYGCNYPLRHHEQTHLIEMVSSHASQGLDDLFNPPLDWKPLPYTEYRYYRCPKDQELNPNAWEDITDKTYYVKKDDGTLEWLMDRDRYTVLVRSDLKHLSYRLSLDVDQGYLQFLLAQKVIYNNKNIFMKVLVPMGNLDIWLNGKALVPGVDFFVDFPKVVITNKTHLENPHKQKQRVDIRYMGFWNTEENPYRYQKVGYVKHGRLSRNKQFDVRDDKVLHIAVGGHVMHRNDLNFEENINRIIVPDYIKDGMPYKVRDLEVSMRQFPEEEIYTAKRQSEQIDQTIEAYLTQYFPDETFPQEKEIQKFYDVYCPLIGHITDGLLENTITFEHMESHYDDNQLNEWLKSFEFLLAFDPILHPETWVDNEYVNVHPHCFNHVVDVNVYQYKLIKNIIRVLYKNKIDMSSFYRIV